MKRRAVLASVSAVVLAGCTGPAADGDGTTDGGTTDATTTGDGTTAGDAPAYEDTELEVQRVGCGSPAEDATVAIDEVRGTVTVEGTTSGRDSCYTARVASATYDEQADEYRLVVEAYSDAEPDEACAECIVEIDYEATATFDGGLPGEVVVVHRGSEGETEVATARP